MHVDIWSIILLKINISLLRINKSESLFVSYIFLKKIDHFKIKIRLKTFSQFYSNTWYMSDHNNGKNRQNKDNK